MCNVGYKMDHYTIGPPPSKFIRKGRKSRSIGNKTTVQDVDIYQSENTASSNMYDTILMFIMDDV